MIVLHGDSKRGQMQIMGRIYLSSDADAVRALVDDAVEPMKFFVGYAGWAALQLEAEVGRGDWEVLAIEPHCVLETPRDAWEDLHRQALEESRGNLRPAIDPRRIPPDPSVN